MANNKERIENNNTRLSAISTQLDDLPPYIEPVASNISYDNNSSGLTANNVQSAIDELTVLSAAPTVVTASLLASRWNADTKTYSFETDYPVATYDIEIALDSTATSEQAESFNGAQIVGSATSNIIKAYGDVPTVNIPIILKAVTK